MPDAGRSFQLVEGVSLVIGRGEKSSTRLTDGTISRLHCELKWDGNHFTLLDLDSPGGTFVAGQKVKEHKLRHDEEFLIGGTRLELETTGSADAQTIVASQKPARELKADDSDLTGKTISHYEIGAPIARGRTGTLYKARDTRDGKDAARELERIAKFQGMVL